MSAQGPITSIIICMVYKQLNLFHEVLTYNPQISILEWPSSAKSSQCKLSISPLLLVLFPGRKGNNSLISSQETIILLTKKLTYLAWLTAKGLHSNAIPQELEF